jgi:tetratricopeptide (TPR) repeat protein
MAYASEQPGALLAPLRALASTAPRWERLTVAPDTGETGGSQPGAPAEVDEILWTDPSRDLALLRAPAIGACRPGGPVPVTGASADPPADPALGETLLGVRERSGYRPRVFQAILERRVETGGGPDLLLIRIADGGGAGAGALLDLRRRLIGWIVASPPGGDPALACAVKIGDGRVLPDPFFRGRPPREGLTQVTGDFAGTAAGLIAQALLLSRDDQAQRALDLLDRAIGIGGGVRDLIMERALRRFRLGRTEAAIEDFEALVDRDPEFLPARFNLGVALGAAGRYQEAAASFARLLEIDPDHARARFQLALALRAAGFPELARSHCERLGRLDPDLSLELRNFLGF